ncbi:hypothetical protein ANN_20121 [Periplaneta americana]|uniref:Histone-lysine N-methyltransferase SETMAR n=1 Tax=Periplaneta americana TaxID=6978 RepID=A0ABQ8SC05_PERAM|nr:hypothetical protein ANN_20121 [Periplaneta americana]
MFVPVKISKNSPPHTDVRIRQEITKLGHIVLPHPPYSPDLASSDFHFFGPQKNAIRGKQIIEDIRTWLRGRPEMA